MVGKKRKIVWDNQAKEYLRKATQYIKLDSPQNAEKVKNAIRLAVEEIPKYPERYPPDKYRLNNNSEYRCFLLYDFSISYFINTDEIRIVRIRHSKQKPLYY